jgi:uncharacterized membrane protein
MTSRLDEQTDATVQQLVGLYDAHENSATAVQHLANRLTGFLARPATLSGIVIGVLGWMIGNYVARMLGSRALEEFPFPDLAFFATIAAFLVALLILTTQRHEEALAEKRAQLTLQIAVLSEKKIAKVIALLEEQRRDNPLLRNRVDHAAEAMTEAADPNEHLQRIEAARTTA